MKLSLLVEKLERITKSKVILKESKEDDYRDLYVTRKNLLSEKEFAGLLALDTAPFIYLPWIIKQYSKNKETKGIVKQIKDIVEQFKAMKQNLQNKDINYYETLIDLRYALDTNESLIKKLNNSEGVKKVAEEGNKFLYAIFTKKAAQKYGAGSRWCIAAQNGSMWGNYASNNIFYFYIDNDLEKQGDKTHYKYAIQVPIKTSEVKDKKTGETTTTFESSGRPTYWDATDRSHDKPPAGFPSAFSAYISRHSKDSSLIMDFKKTAEIKSKVDRSADLQTSRLKRKITKAQSLQTWLELEQGIPKGFTPIEKEKISNSNIKSLYNLQEVKYLDLTNCTSLKDLGSLHKAETLILKNTALETLGNLEEITEFLDVRMCPNLKDIGKLRSVGEVYIDSNHPLIPQLKTITQNVYEI